MAKILAMLLTSRLPFSVSILAIQKYCMMTPRATTKVVMEAFRVK
jgi:hypothetical protein